MSKEIKISTELIKLDQFLKWAGVVRTGGDAKVLIQAGNVQVNGEVELRRGRVLRASDTVSVSGKDGFIVACENEKCT